MDDLRPTIVPPQTIEEMNASLVEATAKILGVSGPSNVITLVRDVVIPELTVEQQALIAAITPKIGVNGEWYVGDTATNLMASNFAKSPDGSIWSLSGIDNTGTSLTWVKVFSPTAP